LVVLTEIALLTGFLDAVAAVGGKPAVWHAGAVAAVVAAVVALFAIFDHAVAALQLAAKIAGALRGAVVGAVVALFAGVHHAVAAGGGRRRELAVGVAGAGHGVAVLFAVVALFSVGRVHRAVAAERDRQAAIEAKLWIAVARGHVLVAIVAELALFGVDAGVPAVGSERAIGHAGAVAAVVAAVVALFVAVLPTIPAVGGEPAVGAATAVGAVVVLGAVVALFAGLDHAVAALERAAGVASAGERAVLGAVVAGLGAVAEAIAAEGRGLAVGEALPGAIGLV